jgi:two-component system NtrC family response regulator
MEKLLIVEDNPEIRKQLKWGLGKEYEVHLAGEVDEGLAVFRKEKPKVVVLDLGLPPEEDGTSEGFRCLEEMLLVCPAAKIIIATGNDEKESALRAIQTGAYDFYQKPIDLGELKVIIGRAYHLNNLENENRKLQLSLHGRNDDMGGIIGQCPEMQQVFVTIRKVASTEASVFLNGESGTGKELAARAIHDNSSRQNGPFVAINCGAIPENLLESELFGYEKGAFTGANARVQGKIEYANKGTLFFDEIGELPASLQVKLLRFLQERVIQRVGGREDIAVDVRIVSATNIDISKAIKAGTFREDLYYRIAVISLNLPPLRERGDDIMILANFFLKRFSESLNRKTKGFSAAAAKLMQVYDWPGNVRELENRVQRALIMSNSVLVEAEDLGFDGNVSVPKSEEAESLTLRHARERAEKEIIESIIKKHKGNVLKAAEILGISRPTLYSLMRKHGLEV